MVHGKVTVVESPWTQHRVITKMRKEMQYLIGLTKARLGTSITSVMKVPEEGNKQLLTKEIITKNVPEERNFLFKGVGSLPLGEGIWSSKQ